MNEQIFALAFTGQRHDDVIRFHRLLVALKHFLRNLPHIFLVEEYAHVGHVVAQILLRLNVKQILWITQMVLQIFGHRAKRLEQSREGIAVGLNDGVLFVGDVVVHGAVVGVNRNFYRVADVVDIGLGIRRGIREASAVGKRILNPNEIAFVGQHDVRIAIQFQEGGNHPYPVLNLAVNLDAGLGVDFIAEQHVGVSQANSEGEPFEERIQRDAAGAFVAGVDVFVAAGIAELITITAYKHLVVGKFTVVNFRTGHLYRDFAFWRQVFNEKFRLAVGGKAIDGVHDDAVAVGKFQLFVDPGKRGQLGFIQLAGGQHYLPNLAINFVAINVHFAKDVIRP